MALMKSNKPACLCCNDKLPILDAKRLDPTGTLTLRGKFEQNLVGRFNRLKTLITQSVAQNDAFGLKSLRIGDSVPQSIVMDAQAIPQRAFSFERPADKVGRFMAWLNQAQNDGILEVQAGASQVAAAQASWMNTYIDTAYTKGIRDAVGKLKAGGATVAESWTSQAFFRPIHADRLGLIYTRAYSDLDGITKTMDQQISRILAQGIGEGRGPAELARQINERVDKIGITRARVLARTEIVSAHAEATLNSYTEAGLEGVEIEAEWTLGQNPCELCQDAAANGPYTIEQARGMLPLHPNCMCAWNPRVVGGTGIELV